MHTPRAGTKLAGIVVVGAVYGRLTVTEAALDSSCRCPCRCECGTTGMYNAFGLASGNTSSCGCLNIEAIRQRSTKHGGSRVGMRTRENRIWISMRNRCNNPKNIAYANYGGRGIKVCQRWDSFRNFLADIGEIPPGMSLDRIDNDGDYCPENVRLATGAQQALNRRVNRLITFEGVTMTAKQWSERTGIKSSLIRSRLDKLGWSVERALTVQVNTEAATANRYNRP